MYPHTLHFEQIGSIPLSIYLYHMCPQRLYFDQMGSIPLSVYLYPMYLHRLYFDKWAVYLCLYTFTFCTLTGCILTKWAVYLILYTVILRTLTGCILTKWAVYLSLYTITLCTLTGCILTKWAVYLSLYTITLCTLTGCILTKWAVYLSLYTITLCTLTGCILTKWAELSWMCLELGNDGGCGRTRRPMCTPPHSSPSVSASTITTVSGSWPRRPLLWPSGQANAAVGSLLVHGWRWGFCCVSCFALVLVHLSVSSCCFFRSCLRLLFSLSLFVCFDKALQFWNAVLFFHLTKSPCSCSRLSLFKNNKISFVPCHFSHNYLLPCWVSVCLNYL